MRGLFLHHPELFTTKEPISPQATQQPDRINTPIIEDKNESQYQFQYQQSIPPSPEIDYEPITLPASPVIQYEPPSPVYEPITIPPSPVYESNTQSMHIDVYEADQEETSTSLDTSTPHPPTENQVVGSDSNQLTPPEDLIPRRTVTTGGVILIDGVKIVNINGTEAVTRSEVHKLPPSDVEIYMKKRRDRADFYIKTGELYRALNEASNVVMIRHCPDNLCCLARVLSAFGATETAITEYNKILAAQPNHKQAIEERSNLLAKDIEDNIN